VRQAGTTAPIADAVVGRWLTPGFAAANPEIRDWLHAMLIAQPPDGYAECCGAIERMDLRGELHTITAPTLVLQGTADNVVDSRNADVLAARIPGARLELFPGAGHLFFWEQPDRFVRIVTEFLQ